MEVRVAEIIRSALLLSLLAFAGCHAGPALDSMYTVAPLTYDFGNGTSSVSSAKATPVPVIDPKTGIPAPIDLDRFYLPGDDIPALVKAVTDETGRTRDRLKAALVERSNLICQYTQAQIVGTNDWINFGLGETTTILGAAGSIVTGATPARILAGLAGLVNSTRSQVNEIFYQNALKVAIIQRIDNTRRDRLALINAHNGEPTSSYMLEEMIADVREYHKGCSFFSAVIGLSQQSVAAPSEVASPSGGGRDPKKLVPPNEQAPASAPTGATSDASRTTNNAGATGTNGGPAIGARVTPSVDNQTVVVRRWGGIAAVDRMIGISPTEVTSSTSPEFIKRIKAIQNCKGITQTGRVSDSLLRSVAGSPGNGANGCPLPASASVTPTIPEQPPLVLTPANPAPIATSPVGNGPPSPPATPLPHAENPGH